MRWLTIAVAVTACLLVVGGCGGDDDEAASDTTALTDTTTDETTTDDLDETTTDDSEDTTADDLDDLDELASGECRDLVEAGQQLSQVLGAASLSDEDLDDASRFFDEFADSAPEEIRADFQVLAEAWEVYAEVLPDLQVEPGETPDPEALQKLQEATAQLDQQELTAASERIQAWTTENC